MTEHKKRERYGNYFPPVTNCRGGIFHDHLCGSLAYEQIQEVKSLPIERDIGDQQAMVVAAICSNQNKAVDIFYYPKEVVDRRGRVLLTPIIGAQCSNIDCEHNSALPTKRS